MKNHINFLLAGLCCLFLASAEKPSIEFIRFTFEGKPYNIPRGGQVNLHNIEGNTWLFIQQVSEDTITFSKPSIDFGVILSPQKEYTDEEILALTKDTIFVPKEFGPSGQYVTREMEQTLVPRPYPIYFFDGKMDFSCTGLRNRGYIKLNTIKKVTEKRYLCSGVFNLEYIRGDHPYLFKDGAFSLILNLR